MKKILIGLIMLSSISAYTFVKNGMEIRWKFLPNKQLEIRLSAPTNGWLAIGFNTKSGLKGTNLIMATIKNAEVEIEDHYIIAAGDHQKVEDLGGKNHLLEFSGTESLTETKIIFTLDTQADDHHHHLKAGHEYFILLAYSRSDDFDHHSTMRTEVKLKL
jgi:hypothetical protein